MNVVPPKTHHTIKRLLKSSGFFIVAFFSLQQLQAQQHSWLTDSSVNVIDATNAVYHSVHPGDTIYLAAGSRDKLLIRNFKGTVDSPVVFINKGGAVNISTNSYYGIAINNCRYIRLSGQGSSGTFYGIQIAKVAAGCGIGIGAMSSDFEIDHIAITHCSTEGIYAKTDPDCAFIATRDKFTQFNTDIHDNYIADIGNEGMYIGSSYYAGMTITCSGKDTVVMPPVLNGVTINNNIVKNTGWDGIQVSSAPLHCHIFNNTISHDSQAEMPNQMSGILLGGGSKCNCNNNLVTDGKGDGIENHGLGGNNIFNNIIVNAGRDYLPNDLTQMKHGIFVSDISVQQDSSVNIFFNDIINPKSDGIRFQSIKSRHNLISGNLIVNPGNYNFYPYSNTAFTSNDAYIMIPLKTADVQVKNNYFSKNLLMAGIAATDYSILPGSPLINQGDAGNGAVSYDYYYHRRPVGGLFDIGATEYSGGADTLLHTTNDRVIAFPNPASTSITFQYLSVAIDAGNLQVYNSTGQLVLQQNNNTLSPGIQQWNVDVAYLPRGLYVYTFTNAQQVTFGKFIKL